MKKDIEYYLSLPYTIELIPEGEVGWFVGIKEFPGCMTETDTREEALREIELLKREWLEIALEEGISIPEPRLEDEYSGKFNLRVPKSLHRKLVEAADKDGVSLNTYCISSLSESIEHYQYTDRELHAPSDLESFSSALRNWQHATGIDQIGSETLEENFASWLAAETNEALEAYRASDLFEAIGNLGAIARLLRGAGRESLLLQAVAQLVENLSQSLKTQAEPTLPHLLESDTRIGDVVIEVNKQTIIRQARPSPSLESARSSSASTQFEEMVSERRPK